MTREEKQKAIDALKISAPIMAVTQEEFNDYIQTLNKIMDWLEQGPILDKIRAEIEQLPTNTRTNWDGCCPDIDYPEIEYVDVTKAKLLEIIDKYKGRK